MPGILDGKVAIVTGAGRGVGRGIATEYAKEGASVVVASRTLSTVDEVVEEIRSAGGRALGVACDIGHADQIDAMVAEAVAEFGTVDILVNNAQGFGTEDTPTGSPHDFPLEDYPEEEWDWMFETGAKATLRTMKAAFPYLKRRGGRIINFGSRIGVVVSPGFASYAANKEAIRALSRVAASEWGRHGINVNVVNPVLESRASNDFNERYGTADHVVAVTPLGRTATAAEGARVAVFLAGPDSSWLTGMTFFLDGGMTLLP